MKVERGRKKAARVSSPEAKRESYRIKKKDIEEATPKLLSCSRPENKLLPGLSQSWKLFSFLESVQKEVKQK